MTIQKVAVIGAGVMGSAIAAHVSNAGIPVYLLDIVPPGASNRNVIAETAIAKLLKAEPAPFMHPKNAKLITPGNIDDHLDWLADADWIIEAVIEDLAVKQQLYRRLDGVCRADALISSNTSTLPLRLLTQNLPDSFKQRFMITHFFNPPRYMRLLELVADPCLKPDLLQTVSQFADECLGKGCVVCKDTPGFIANRIGTFWMQSGLLHALELDLPVAEADAVLSLPFGVPKTGIFGLLDLIGLDLIPHVLDSFRRTLPADDALRQISETPALVSRMIAEGYTGRKGKGGFYRLQEIDGQRLKTALDLQTGAYHPATKPQALDLTSPLSALLSNQDELSLYAWRVWSRTLSYAASLLPEIADDIIAVDTAMKLGYNWQYGPFELLDKIGVAWFAGKLQADNLAVPPLLANVQAFYKAEARQRLFADLSAHYRPIPKQPGVLQLADIKTQADALLASPSASLWDIGDGVACLEFHSKMNTLDRDTLGLIRQSIAKVRESLGALVIYNDADNFSAGANLTVLVAAIKAGDWTAVENIIQYGQQTYQALKYSPFPVVGAPSGLALGGGCEILLHCDAIIAHAELYAGLVETGVGLIPAWGGCKEYLRRQLQQPKRFGGPIPPVRQAFENIAMARISKSAQDAQELLFLSSTDGIVMNKARLLADAKTKALALLPGYAPPAPCQYPLPGKTAYVLLTMATQAYRLLGKATGYDIAIANQLATVLSGGACDMAEALTEDHLLALELRAFMYLVKQPETLARLEYLLATGKPLRN